MVSAAPFRLWAFKRIASGFLDAPELRRSSIMLSRSTRKSQRCCARSLPLRSAESWPANRRSKQGQTLRRRVVQACDRAMYASKRQGRNRVSVFDELTVALQDQSQAVMTLSQRSNRACGFESARETTLTPRPTGRFSWATSRRYASSERPLRAASLRCVHSLDRYGKRDR